MLSRKVRLCTPCKNGCIGLILSLVVVLCFATIVHARSKEEVQLRFEPHFEVSIQKNPLSKWEVINKTRPSGSVNIPSCYSWRIDLSGCDLNSIDAVVKVIRDKRVPGVYLGNIVSADVLKKIATTNTVEAIYFENATISKDSIAHIIKMKKIKRLAFKNCRRMSHELVEQISKMDTLEYLDIRETKISSKDIMLFANNVHLRCIRFGDQLILSGSLKLLATRMKYLDLDDCIISNNALKSIGDFQLIRRLRIHGRSTANLSDTFLESISGLTKLVSLEIGQYSRLLNISDAGLKCLENLSELQSLTLYVCDKITDAGLESIAKLRSLNELHISGPIPSFGVIEIGEGYQPPINITNEGLKAIEKFAGLKKLSLYWLSKITDPGLQSIATLSKIEKLDLYGLNIEGTGLSKLAKLNSLKSINLGRCYNLSDAGLAHIGRISGLVKLDLQHCDKITNKGLKRLESLGNLRELNLNSCTLTDLGMCSLGKLTALEKLDIALGDEATDVCMESLAKLNNLMNLRIKLGKNVTDSGMRHFGKLGRLRHLSIVLNDNITNAGIGHLGHLKLMEGLEVSKGLNVTETGFGFVKKLSCLHRLVVRNVWGNLPITDISIKHVEILTGLKELDIKNSNITDIGIESIRRLIKLETLDLGYCSKITDNGMQAIGTLICLKHLNLSGCHITDCGLKKLSGLKSLQRLELSSCDITDKGLKCLEKLAFLDYLNLSQCDNITDAGIRSLKKHITAKQIVLFDCKNIKDHDVILNMQPK